MGESNLSGFFEDYLNKESFFLDKKVLESSFIPENIFHREEQINQIAKVLAPALRLEKPSNLFLYGKTGTGKTVSVKYVMNHMTKMGEKRNIPISFIYINCKLKKVADTEYRLIAQIARECGAVYKDSDGKEKEIPSTGLPTDEIYKIFFDIINTKEMNFILVLDEIDQLVKKTSDEVLYNLTRINEDLKKSKVSIVGISNDMFFIDGIDPRVKSSLSQEELVFPPYNAVQIREILKDRAKKSLKESSIQPGVIEKCAAYAAREHGDARRAIDLLRVSAELTERQGKETIEITDLDAAEEKIEKDRIIDLVNTQPKQSQLVLYAILKIHEDQNDNIITGEVYELYKALCTKANLRPLTQRRVSDIIAELDMFGIINIHVVSKGRYGRTRDISLSLHKTIIEKIKKLLEESI